MNFHHIISVFRNDWKRIIRNPVAIIILIGLCIIPSFYAWVNIQACWNVYDNTQEIPVAVVNSDKGASFRGKQLNVGGQIVEQLKKNKKIKWVFTTTKDADLGLVDSTYYAAIEIPVDFSSKLLTVLTNHPQKPQITYKADTKANPVATKITSTANSTLVQQVTTEFISTVNEIAYHSINQLGSEAGKNTGDILKMKDSIVSLSRSMETVTATLSTVSSGSANLSELLKNLNTTMPAVQSSLDAAAKTNADDQKSLAALQDSMDQSSQSVSTNLAFAKTSGQKIKLLFSSLNDTAVKLTEENINSTVPLINSQLSSLNDAIDATTAYLTQCRDYDYTSDIDTAISTLQQLNKDLTELKKALTQMQADTETLHNDTDALYKELNTAFAEAKVVLQKAAVELDSTIKTLNTIYQQYPNENLKSIIDSLKKIQTENLGEQASAAMDNILKTQPKADEIFNKLSAALKNYVVQVDAVSAKISTAVGNLQNFKTTMLTARTQQMTTLIAELQAVKPLVTDLQEQISKVRSQVIDSGDISKETANQINSLCSTMTAHLDRSIQFYNSSVKGSLKKMGGSITAAMQGTSEMITEAKKLSSQISVMLGDAQQGAELSSTFSTDLNSKLQQLQRVIGTVGGKLDVVNNEEIASLIGVMQNDPKLVGNYVSNPFEIKEEAIYPIPNYGTGMAPIYTTLALWVGCLVLNSVLKTDVAWSEGMEQLTLREKHFGKMLLFSTLAMVQALIVALGDIFLLKIYVLEPALFIFFCVYSSLVFSIITFTLVSTLGNVGKALSIIYLILQVAGSGGSYPIQVDPPIFRILQPLFPFTYTLSGLRESIAGTLAGAVTGDVVGLSIFAALFLIGGFLTVRPLHRRFQPFEIAFQKSGLGE